MRCGDPDLITVKGVQLLSRADVVLYDRLVSPTLLERYARKDAEKIEVGKKRGLHTMKQAQIDDLIEEFLSEGKVVARLKGGDPGVFGHSSEEIDIAKKTGASWQIVPGITAAIGCAAHSGIPLTERGKVKSVRIMTLYDKDVYDDGLWQSLASSKQETLVFYMSIKHKNLMCEKLIEGGLSPDTPIMAVEQGTTAEHREYAATLRTFSDIYGETSFISPTLFIVGETVRLRADHGWRDEAAKLKKSFFDHTRIEIPSGEKSMLTAENIHENWAYLTLQERIQGIAALENVTFSTSFGEEDQYLTHLLSQDAPEVSFFTLDTGRVFSETYKLWKDTEDKYNVRIKGAYPEASDLKEYEEEYGINGFYNSLEARQACCKARKIIPLLKSVSGKALD